MLIELIVKQITNTEHQQRVVICYQERIGKQWIEIEQFSTDVTIEHGQGFQEVDFCIQNIKVHLLTKQYG